VGYVSMPPRPTKPAGMLQQQAGPVYSPSPLSDAGDGDAVAPAALGLVVRSGERRLRGGVGLIRCFFAAAPTPEGLAAATVGFALDAAVSSSVVLLDSSLSSPLSSRESGMSQTASPMNPKVTATGPKNAAHRCPNACRTRLRKAIGIQGSSPRPLVNGTHPLEKEMTTLPILQADYPPSASVSTRGGRFSSVCSRYPGGRITAS
jgi:hypothetical protein